MLKPTLNNQKNSRELTICSSMTKLDELLTNIFMTSQVGL